jgi:hypothetical protein
LILLIQLIIAQQLELQVAYTLYLPLMVLVQ